jgi:bifunctional DNase/RNase
VDQLGGEIQDIVISDLKEHTYYAKLRVRKDGELTEIDCRPSDAIAVAVANRVPIYVAEDVLGEALEDEDEEG